MHVLGPVTLMIDLITRADMLGAREPSEPIVVGLREVCAVSQLLDERTEHGGHPRISREDRHIRCESLDSPEVVRELAEIRAAIEEELNATEGVTWKECLLPGNRYRFITGFCLMFWQQFSGTNRCVPFRTLDEVEHGLTFTASDTTLHKYFRQSGSPRVHPHSLRRVSMARSRW